MKKWHGHLTSTCVAVWLWTSCATCQSLNLSTCKMGAAVATAWQMGEK